MDRTRMHNEAPRYARRWKWVLIGFLLVVAFFLWTEHRAHLFGILPYLLLLACPLMHLFHHGHGHGRHRDGADPHAGNTPRKSERIGEQP
ncbi:MAG: DUF2933 domain-containing protein [Bacillota bacterium]